MSFDPHEFDHDFRSGESNYPIGLYISNTFLWMFLGLMISFGTALLCWMTGLARLTTTFGGNFVILLLQLGVVLVLSSRITSMSLTMARGCFLGYSVLTGLTLAVYLYLYEMGSLIFAFLLAALFYGAMGLYGRLTSQDMMTLRPILLGGLAALLLMTLAGLFIPSLRVMHPIMDLFGIAIFMGYTVYDMQMVRNYYDYYQDYPDMLDKASVMAALQLYMDFIGIFIHLLQYIGKRKD